MDGLRRRPLQRGIAKPPIVSALQSHGQEKLDYFRAMFRWPRADGKLVYLLRSTRA
jgi:hypothetical protein